MNPCHWEWETLGIYQWHREWIHGIDNERMPSRLAKKWHYYWRITWDAWKTTIRGESMYRSLKIKIWQTCPMLKFPEITEFKFQQNFWILFPTKMMAAEGLSSRKQTRRLTTFSEKAGSPPRTRSGRLVYFSQSICQKASFGNLTTTSQSERLGV